MSKVENKIDKIISEIKDKIDKKCIIRNTQICSDSSVHIYDRTELN